MHTWKFLLICTLFWEHFADSLQLEVEGEQRKERLSNAYQVAIDRLTSKAKTEECKQLLEQEFEKFWNPLMMEVTYPFERTAFFSECPTASKQHFNPVKFTQDKAYQRPQVLNISRRRETSLDPENLRILYVMLVHNHADFAIRIVQALIEPMHTFVIHVDSKAEQTYRSLLQAHEDGILPNNVFLVPSEERVDVIWGAYSIVRATLIALAHGFSLNRDFDYVLDMSGSTYPVKSKQYIREFLARNPNTIYNNIKPETNFPPPELWHYYVECDSTIHRIARMTSARGIPMHIGSQWFAAPRHVIEWLMKAPLPLSYRSYAEHVVIADEHYFSTMFKNSPFCGDLVNKDVNYVLFSKWETERGNSAKCVQPDPLRCGRSPTTLTQLMKPTILMAQVLFARKFDPDNADSMALVNEIESIRSDRVDDLFSRKDEADNESFLLLSTGKHINLREQQLQLDQPQNCLWMQPKVGGAVRSVPCSASDVNQHFVRDQCITLDANVYNSSRYTPCERGCDSRFVNPTIGEENFSSGSDSTDEDLQTYCRYRGVVPGAKVEGAMAHDEFLCIDIQGQSITPGAPIISYPCTGLWNQFFRLSDDCHLSATQPDAVAQVRGNVDDKSKSTLCLEAFDTSPNSNSVYEMKAKECVCDDDKTHGSQSYKLFSVVNDMPHGMWLSDGKFHAKDKSSDSSEMNLSSPPDPMFPLRKSSTGLARTNTPISSPSSAETQAPTKVPQLKAQVKEAIEASRNKKKEEL